MTKDHSNEKNPSARAPEDSGDPHRAGALSVIDGEEGLFLVAEEAGEKTRWPAEDVRAMRIADGPEGCGVQLSLFDGGCRCVPTPSPTIAKEVLRGFAAAVNARLKRPDDPLAGKLSAAHRLAKGGPWEG